MKTLKFEVEIDLNTNRELTEDELLEIANGIDNGIRKERNEWGIIPMSVMNGGIGEEEVEAKLIRVKPVNNQ
jgi:hypothetical protein